LDAGDTGGVLASTIVRIDGDNWTLIREGVIPEEEIQKALGN
jgi:tRNA A37 threonylcarbamoyladenosine synthetase subunit TsaC/SUA5/YrdC